MLYPVFNEGEVMRVIGCIVVIVIVVMLMYVWPFLGPNLIP
jgi:hypothetical protein